MNSGQQLDLERIFQYHQPTPAKQTKYEALRNEALSLAKTIDDLVPDGADKTDAIRSLRNCIMTCNAAIALDGQLFKQGSNQAQAAQHEQEAAGSRR